MRPALDDLLFPLALAASRLAVPFVDHAVTFEPWSDRRDGGIDGRENCRVFSGHEVVGRDKHRVVVETEYPPNQFGVRRAFQAKFLDRPRVSTAVAKFPGKPLIHALVNDEYT